MNIDGGKQTFECNRPFRGGSHGFYPNFAPPVTLGMYWRFLVAGFKHHGQTGGVVPSQRFLIDRMIAPVPPQYHGEVIELGAGTGVLTVRLAARCPFASIVACEINPVLARDLAQRVRLAGLQRQVRVMTEPAEELLSRRARSTAPLPEFIISGIPLGNLPKGPAIALIETIRQALPRGGMYIQFQHSLMDRKKIKARFARLRTVPALLNFPPAVVYYAVN